MGKTRRKTKALRLTPEDMELIGELKQYHGIASDNEVIRLALRAAKREIGRCAPLPNKQHLSSPAS